MSSATPDSVHTTLDRGLHQLAALGGDCIDHANAIGTILWSPPRVVVVGRLKAGKSTLVNALIGAPVAETAALEATNVVTVYRDGSPSRAEVLALDSTRHRAALRPGAGIELPIPSAEVAYVDRWLPSAALRELTLIDTPGLSTLTAANDAATRRVMIDGFEQTRTASIDADAAVFLFDAAPRVDEIEFLHRLPFTPLTMLGVLSRADSFGEGAFGRRDPLTHAAAHATAMAGPLAGIVHAIVPVSGLMAQTSHTGMLTERHAALLAQLRDVPPLDVLRIFDSEDPTSGGVPPAERRELLALLGEYGVLNGRRIAADGAAALNTWLAERSGIAALRHALTAATGRFAVLHRAHRILARLDQLAFTHPARDHIRTLTAGLRADPALAAVTVLEDYQRMLDVDPDAAVTDELRTILTATTPAGRVGLDGHPPPAAVAAEAHRLLAAAQQRTLATRSAAEDAALVTLIRTYTALAAGH
ncbi:GTPase [Gordonia sp. AC31]|uniref:GTPase n=1 Tax=Gordonia sp. AC31 TaxID=2962571 RepID=UPI002882562D|nr:GTPase [Gordonia sp. AC31]MDT0223643.1 GTPase [Gordonia sp. AC31]